MIKVLKNIGWFSLYLLLGLFALFPLLWGLKLSFTPKLDYNLIPQSLTLANYAKIITNHVITKFFFNSIKVCFGSILIVVPTSLLAAYGISRYDFKGKGLLKICLLIFPMLPSSAILVPLVKYFNKLGLYNTIFGVILGTSVFSLSLTTWMFINFIDNTQKTIEEAALIDGLNPYQTLFRITLPMIKPGLICIIVYIFIGSWNGYTLSYALTTSPDSRVLAQAILSFLGAWGTDWGGLTAMSIIMLIPPIVFFLFFQKSFIAGMFGENLK